MAKRNDLQQEIKELQKEVTEQQAKLLSSRQAMLASNLEAIYYLQTLWADFHICVIQPTLETSIEVKIILPSYDSISGLKEYVYSIMDQGYVLSVSRAQDMFRGVRSTAKFFDTITKMVKLLYHRIINASDGESGDSSGGIANQATTLIAFQGHELGKRKAYELLMSLDLNVKVTNYHPGKWGELHLLALEGMQEKGHNLSHLKLIP